MIDKLAVRELFRREASADHLSQIISAMETGGADSTLVIGAVTHYVRSHDTSTEQMNASSEWTHFVSANHDKIIERSREQLLESVEQFKAWVDSN